MFGRHFHALSKAFSRKAQFPPLHPHNQASQPGGGASNAAHLHQTHRLVATGTTFGPATPVGRIATAGFGFGCAGAAVLGTTSAVTSGQKQAEPLLDATSSDDDALPSSSGGIDVMELPWVQTMAGQEGVREVLSPGQMLRQNPIAKFLVDQDHLFETMVQSRQIRDFRCFYDAKREQFHSVVLLGRDVCGFPQTVHGGLTAAIMDETFGGLCVSLWRQGRLGLQPPGYTARLEVDYKQKIPAGSVVVCSTALESVDQRKVWMRATMSDGAGTTYAVARALFVSPKLLPGNVGNVLTSWMPGRGKREREQQEREQKAAQQGQ